MPAKRTFSGSGRNQPTGSAPEGSPKSAALTLLARRDYTTSELRTRLIDRGFDLDAVEATVRDLTSARLLDDARVAAAHARTALHVKSRGRARVARELAARGLSRDAVDRALDAIEPDAEDAAIRKLLKRKRYPAAPTLKERQRMFQHLLRRGFRSDLIRRVLGRGAWDAGDEGDG